MRKKRRKSQAQPARRQKRRASAPLRTPRDRPLENRILTVCHTTDEPVSLNDLLRLLDLPRSHKDHVKNLIDHLVQDKKVRLAGKRAYQLSHTHRLYEATLSMSQSGFGFATDIVPMPKKLRPGKDPYIGSAYLETARHGDRVLMELVPGRSENRPEARVIAVITRNRQTIAGFFRQDKHFGVVTPEDSRFPLTIKLLAQPQMEINDGDAVIVSIDEQPMPGQPPVGTVLEVLGPPSDITVQQRLVIEKYDLPHRFSPQVLHEASCTSGVPPAEQRVDLRDVVHFTIDGEDAKDFDDAIGIAQTDDGFRLHVSIADVSAFVKPGTELDHEAYKRGTSVYFPNAVIPMLPENLSNNLCSLVPHEERLTVSVILDFDAKGVELKKHFCRSVIVSRQRFTYTAVKQIIVDEDPEAIQAHQQFVEHLNCAAELARLLQQKRQIRGSINFTIPEPYITIADNGEVTEISRAERTFAHQIIEEFMLAANEAVARHFDEQTIDSIYRIHEDPSLDKIEDFLRFARTLDLDISGTPTNPVWFNGIIKQVAGTPKEYIINNLLLRTMQQARYSPKNSGHFGLATDRYTHFTSPIRRYPDLIVHRLLCASLNKPNQPKVKKGTAHERLGPLFSQAQHLSERERLAVTSERDMAERLKSRFMANHIGDRFSAVISGVSDTLFFVELQDYFVSGAVSLASLTDDYYLLDKNNHRLIGDVTGTILQIGDLVSVVLLDVDLLLNRISFTLAGKEA